MIWLTMTIAYLGLNLDAPQRKLPEADCAC